MIDYEAAIRPLIRLVRDEWPSNMSLVEIADIWGEATDEELEALKGLEEQKGSAFAPGRFGD